MTEERAAEAAGPGKRHPALGLALSGGGFRAAFFHIGVLARMAELGYLRNVEVISTVSGGSIVGALYYLRLKELLEENKDGKISDTAYCMLVAEVESQLRDAVRLNIRARIFSNVAKNVQMAGRSYSRSKRIGDLYDRHIYKPAWPGRRETRVLGREEQIRLCELLIRPKNKDGDIQEDFKPDEHNEHRKDKVPILLINATSLNTGHAWRFEAIRMGEPLPSDEYLLDVVQDVDKNMRLGRGYFREEDAIGDRRAFKDEHLRDFTLGNAVAASAAVPGVFQPVTLQNAYDGIDVQLVDGGVYDNQGVQGLLDMNCARMIVSDGSGQMDDVPKPATRIPAVLQRSSSIPRDALRDEQLVRVRMDTEKHHLLMHLRKGLHGSVVEVGKSLEEAKLERTGKVRCESFHVDHEVQEALSNIRTDLDFFSHVEASSLELDAYRMTVHLEGAYAEKAIWKPVKGTAVQPPHAGALPWRFEEVQHLINTSGYKLYLKQLRVGAQSFVRPLRWPGPARWLLCGGVVVALALVALAFIFWELGDDIADVAHDLWHLDGVVVAAVVIAVLGWLYTASSAPSRWTFAALSWIVIPLAALPLAIFAWGQIALQPLLNRLDRLPRPPAVSEPGGQ